eukprot:scaffold196238_cov38-Attheya_sp.AAC.2
MEKTTSEWNEGNPLLSSVEAQQKLADVINILGTKVMPYCWKLTGNDPDSLCNLLNVDERILHLSLQSLQKPTAHVGTLILHLIVKMIDMAKKTQQQQTNKSTLRF